MWRALASNTISLLIVGLIALGVVIAWGQARYGAPQDTAEAVCVSVPRGGTMGAVSESLVDLGAIDSAMIFRLGADYSGRAGDLKAGNFLVPAGASMAEIVETVTGDGRSTCGRELNYRIGVNALELELRELDPATGGMVELASFAPGEAAPASYAAFLEDGFARFRVTMVEGATSWQVTEGLRKADFLAGNIADVPPEGVLAPGSYEVAQGTERAAVLQAMNEAQEATLAAAWAGRAADLPLNSPFEALTLASIIEKETGLAEERGAVASVFVNRLNRGMRLQTDPTVIYGVTEGKGVLGRGLRRSELRRATPYNTYVIEGLPPTPIANPGAAAIQAALNPEDTDYIFFVADGTGGHAFAETLDEHNANVRRWREIERARANQ
ncbi:MAG: endolytic transglycosylase MltG [Mangrovicoccus sp.]|nr:endolytic transglycosylase MltG [Mangrovicoccus sp.]